MPSLAALAALGLTTPAYPAAAQALPDSLVYAVAPGSTLEVRTGKAGILGGLGHEHLVRAGRFEGTIVHVPGDPARSHVRLTVATDGLEILTDASPSDRAKMRRAMREETLRVTQYPEIRFSSRAVEPVAGGLRIAGVLTLGGVTRPLSVDVALRQAGDTLHATTEFSLRQTDYGIEPYSTALGTVRVADRVRFSIAVVALPAYGLER